MKKFVGELDVKTPFVNNRPGKKSFDSFMQRHKTFSQKHAEYVNRVRGSVTEENDFIRKYFSSHIKIKFSGWHLLGGGDMRSLPQESGRLELI